MHPRNAYASQPDFLDLARRYPPLRQQYVLFYFLIRRQPHDYDWSVFLTHTGPTIDFKSAPAQRSEKMYPLNYRNLCLVSSRRLTEALLYLDFNISLTLPDNRLCPPVRYRF